LNGERDQGISGGALFALYARASKIPLYPPFEKGGIVSKEPPLFEKEGQGEICLSHIQNNFPSKANRKLCVLLLLGLAALAGCQQKMADQPRYEPLAKSDFFGDERSARPLVEGTVARGQLRSDGVLYTGKVNGTLTETLPFPVTKNVLLRGQERYDIFCSPCHDRVGTGQGMVVRRGLRAPPSFHTDRLRTVPAGHFFDVITHGFGIMPDYAAQVAPKDRWAIVAYIRALQLSQNAKLANVPESERRSLETKP
jgi:hypothetical protein